MEFSPNSEYVFDNVSFYVEVYTTNSDYRQSESTSKQFVNGNTCWRVGSSSVKLSGNNSLKQTFESMYADDIASESDYFYVIEDISGTVSSGSSNNDNSSHVYTIEDAIYNTDTDNMFDEIEDNYAKITLSEIRDSDKSKLNNLHEQLGFTKGVDIGTSSGRIHFKLFDNNMEIHSEISKLLLERQHGKQNAKTSDLPDELKKFKELLDSGVITQEEFDAKKKQLLGL